MLLTLTYIPEQSEDQHKKLASKIHFKRNNSDQFSHTSSIYSYCELKKLTVKVDFVHYYKPHNETV